MNKMLRRILIAMICLVLAGFAALNVFAYKHAQAMLYFSDQAVATPKPEKLSLAQKISVLFTGINVPRPVASMSPSALDNNCKHEIIPNDEKSSLGAWYCQGNDNQRLVILFHGYVMDKSSLVKQAKVFLQAKYSVLLVDFRGSWESSESYTTIGYWEANDVASAVKYAEQHHPHKKLVLYGQSMGAAAILRAVDNLNVKADAIIIEAVFDTLFNTVKNRFDMMGVPVFPSAHLLVFWGGLQAGFNGFDHNPVEYAKAVTVPALFFHGEADTRARLSEAQQVYESIPSTKKFSIFPDTVHESHVARFPEKWKNEVISFLDKNL